MKIHEEIFYKVKRLFIWTSDKVIHPDYYDHWMSHADAVDRGEIFRDDCDGFSLTCAELLYRAEYAHDQIRIAYCQTETGEGHLVCLASGWLLDNRQRHVWAWNEITGYKWISSMSLGEPGIWRRMG
jgi:predicted transglutaminase-like cysteine proteinase